MVVPPVIIHFGRISNEINHPASSSELGVLHCRKPPSIEKIIISIDVLFPLVDEK